MHGSTVFCCKNGFLIVKIDFLSNKKIVNFLMDLNEKTL